VGRIKCGKKMEESRGLQFKKLTGSCHLIFENILLYSNVCDTFIKKPTENHYNLGVKAPKKVKPCIILPFAIALQFY